VNLRKFIREVLEQVDDYNLIVKAGTELYHGTIEDFDKNSVRPGGYDKLFWTADNSPIAQTYIPTAPSSIYTNSEIISLPSKDRGIQNIQKSFGIEYNYADVEFDGQRAKSYRPAPVFSDMYDQYYKIRSLYFQKATEFENLEKEIYNNRISDVDEREKRYKIYLELKKEIEQLKSDYWNSQIEKLRNKYVNDHLEKLGYEPYHPDNYHLNHGWKLKFDMSHNIMPAHENAPGRLFIVIPKRDLKIYDATLAGQREADLTDIDYHKHSWFETARKQGYDGIRITDYAQSDDQGNVGHLSIGLFDTTLKDLTIHEMPAKHQPLEQFFKSGSWHTPEYSQYKKI